MPERHPFGNIDAYSQKELGYFDEIKKYLSRSEERKSYVWNFQIQPAR